MWRATAHNGEDRACSLAARVKVMRVTSPAHIRAAAVGLTCPTTARQPSATAKATSPAAERQLGVCCGMVDGYLRQEEL